MLKHNQHLRSFSLFVLLALGVTGIVLPAQGKIWVIDKHGGVGNGTWLELGHAEPYAQDGDTFLVRAGNYQSVRFARGKTLTIIHDSRTGPAYFHGIHVSNLPAGKNMTFQGVSIGARLNVSGCDGSVVFDQCKVFGTEIRFSACPSVTLTRCETTGPSGGPGMYVTDTNLRVFDSVLRGGQSGDAISTFTGAHIETFGTDILGGDARSGTVMHGSCYNGPLRGGNGLALWAGSVAMHGGALLGGAPATPKPPCPGAAGGTPFVKHGGSLVTTAFTPRRFVASSTVREGERLNIAIHGQPGDHAFLLFSLAHDPTPVPGCIGALIPSLQGLGMFYVGEVQSAPIGLSFTVAPMAAATNFTQLSTQAWIFPKQGCIFSPPATVMLLDKRF